MAATVQIGSVRAAPGSKASGFLAVPGTPVQMPVTVVHSVDEGPTLLITAGIHGGEYPSIEAAIRFAAELEPQQLSGTVVVMPLVSPTSFHARQAFLVPEDGKNLNRQFPGRARGTSSERMAHALVTEVVAQVDAWVDLHGGDLPEALVPLLGSLGEDDDRVRGMVEAFGIANLVTPSQLPGTSLSAAAALGVAGLLAEAGQLGRLDEEHTLLLLRGCRNVARYLGILPGEAPRTPNLKRFRDWPWVRAGHSGCWYPGVEIGASVRQGQVLGVIKDYFGTPVAEYCSPAAGTVLLLASSLAINEGDPLVGVGVE